MSSVASLLVASLFIVCCVYDMAVECFKFVVACCLLRLCVVRCVLCVAVVVAVCFCWLLPFVEFCCESVVVCGLLHAMFFILGSGLCWLALFVACSCYIYIVRADFLLILRCRLFVVC